MLPHTADVVGLLNYHGLLLHQVDCEASMLAVIGGKDVDRLPSASTCYNMLKLPNYRSVVTVGRCIGLSFYGCNDSWGCRRALL